MRRRFPTRVTRNITHPADSLQDIRVLVVDDHDASLMILKELLRDMGAPVVGEANLGWQAVGELERAAAWGDPYHLVLLDFQLPDLDGYQVVELMARVEPVGAQHPLLHPGLIATGCSRRE